MQITISNSDKSLMLNYTDISTRDRSRYLEGKSQIPLLPAMLIPVRTNNLKNFANDFFLPSTLNHAVKIDGIAKKIFPLFLFFVLDLATLPIRAITCIPRAIYNATQKRVPLSQFLSEYNDPIAQKLALEEGVWVEIKGVIQSTAVEERVAGWEIETVYENTEDKTFEQSGYLPFIDVPKRSFCS